MPQWHSPRCDRPRGLHGRSRRSQSQRSCLVPVRCSPPDSRYYGPVPQTSLRGRVCARIWPPRAAQVFDRAQGRPLRNDLYLRAMEEDPDIVALARRAAAARRRHELRRRELLDRFQAELAAEEARTPAVGVDSIGAAVADEPAVPATLGNELEAGTVASALLASAQTARGAVGLTDRSVAAVSGGVD